MESVAPKYSSEAVASVPGLFHPTIAVPDLEEARIWFVRLFGRKDVRWPEFFDLSILNEKFPKNYSFFMHVADLPLYVGRFKYYGRLAEIIADRPYIAWFSSNIQATLTRLNDHGFRAYHPSGKLIDKQPMPVSPLADDIWFCYINPDDDGSSTEFLQLGDRHYDYFIQEGAPTLKPDWRLPEVSKNDPLRIVRSTHMTTLTGDGERAARFYRDALGAKTLGTEYNADLDADSTFYDFAGRVLEFAVPRDSSASIHSSDRDQFHAMTFQVEDLDVAERHITSLGIPCSRSASGALTIAPEHGYGMTWRFVEHFSCSGSGSAAS